MSDKTYIGIDIGKSGAIADLDAEGEVSFIDMPIIGKGKTSRYDIRCLLNYLSCFSGGLDCFAAIEKPIAMPGLSVSAIATAFEGYGILCACLVANKIPYQSVTPRVWQKVMYAGEPKRKKPKDTSIIVAQRLWPNVNFKRTLRCTTIDHNRTDALLIAEWARRMNL